MGTFFAFLWTSNWYGWYVSEDPGVEFKVRLMFMRGTCASAWYARAHQCSHECNFPKLPLKIIFVDFTFVNHVAVLV